MLRHEACPTIHPGGHLTQKQSEIPRASG